MVYNFIMQINGATSIKNACPTEDSFQTVLLDYLVSCINGKTTKRKTDNLKRQTNSGANYSDIGDWNGSDSWYENGKNSYVKS